MIVGRLELIIGCMFSGKSSELIKRIKKHSLLGKQILVVNHAKDVRYGRGVMSHDKVHVHAIALDKLSDIFRNKDLYKSDIVFVDEGQFFHDLHSVCVDLVDVLGKTVVVSALDGTWERKPFEQVVNLIPMADDVVRLKAMCMICRDGTPAPFSKRIVEGNSLEIVGGIESYIPVCRHHFLHSP